MTDIERDLERASAPDDGGDLEELGRWVVWLIGRYPLGSTVVPPCWHLHSEFIEELGALHGAWHASYGPAARPEAPLHWHEAFEHAQRRLNLWTRRLGCRNGLHHDPRPHSEPRDPGTPLDELDVIYVSPYRW